MKKVRSRFESFFYLRLFFGLALFLGFSGVFVYQLMQYPDIKPGIMVFAGIFIAFLLYMSSGLFSVYSLMVNNKGIRIVKLLTRKRRFIPYSSIVGYTFTRVEIQTSSGNVSDNYFAMVLKLNDGEEFVIMPDTFDNYDKLVDEIKLHVTEITE